MEGIKRIQEMAKGQKDFVLLEVVKYLTSRTDMDEKYLNTEKTLKGMAKYIQDEVMKDFCEKMNTKNPSSFAQDIGYGINKQKCLAIGFSEEKTYELAINYFSKSNKELGIESEEKKTAKKETKKSESKKEIKNEMVDDEFGSIFGMLDNTSEDTSKAIETKHEEIEQISLFAA